MHALRTYATDRHRSLDDAPFGQTTLRLDPGDTLVLLTDGILEALESLGEHLTALWEAVVETLCRRTKRNPVLVGPAGTVAGSGTTAAPVTRP